MLKTCLAFLVLPLLLAGCTSTHFTNLTPSQQVQNPNNLYPVEVALHTRQQTLRWDSIKPYVVVNGEFIPLRPTPLMTNRWEGLVPAAPGSDSVTYQYKFDFLNNAMGNPVPNSSVSREYNLKLIQP